MYTRISGRSYLSRCRRSSIKIVLRLRQVRIARTLRIARDTYSQIFMEICAIAASSLSLSWYTPRTAGSDPLQRDQLKQETTKAGNKNTQLISIYADTKARAVYSGGNTVGCETYLEIKRHACPSSIVQGCHRRPILEASARRETAIRDNRVHWR